MKSLHTIQKTCRIFRILIKVAMILSFVWAGLTDGTLFTLAFCYLKTEQADGTPFTQTGAVKIRQLGISTIVMPIVAVIVSSVIYGCLQAVDTANSAIYAAVDHGDDLPTPLLGVMLILVSFIFRYGAELEEAHRQQCAAQSESLCVEAGEEDTADNVKSRRHKF